MAVFSPVYGWASLGKSKRKRIGVTHWQPRPLPPEEEKMKLKPCPFCGSEADGPEGLWIECTNNKCSALISGDTEEQAIIAWNTRANKSDWRNVHELFLEIGEDLMSIGTHSIMSEDWYAMIEKKIDHGITLAYRKKTGGEDKR